MTILYALTVVTGTCAAIDGDTLRCRIDGQAQTMSVRLLGIDAPEMPGHCRKGRTCAPGNPHAAKASLAKAVAGQRIALQVIARDKYGRTIARAATSHGDLSCHQLRQGAAIYVAKWDKSHAIAGTCRSAAR